MLKFENLGNRLILQNSGLRRLQTPYPPKIRAPRAMVRPLLRGAFMERSLPAPLPSRAPASWIEIDMRSRLVRDVLIVPMVHVRLFDHRFQREMYELFHREAVCRIGHMICTPLIMLGLF